MLENTAFVELNDVEEMQISGGAIGLATVLFTIGAIKVTVGHCLAGGAALGLAAVAIG